ncbi:MAG: hypothetical protein M3R17_04765 [Bacteroidota bacterium]|nr:hypothetical protein [Bacteroidota bacterium]
MKKILLALFVLVAVSAHAQYVELKGLTFQATTYYDTDDGASKAKTCNEIFDISFSDGFMVHNILTEDGKVDQAQFYKISDLRRSSEDGITWFKFNAISGVSGNSYKYWIKINGDGVATISLITADADITYKGGTYNIKTYDQNP